MISEVSPETRPMERVNARNKELGSVPVTSALLREGIGRPCCLGSRPAKESSTALRARQEELDCARVIRNLVTFT